MDSIRIRPQFDLEFRETPDVVMARLRERLPECANCTGFSRGNHAELFVPKTDQKIWSPWLSVTVEGENGHTVLKGRFAPHPSIWTWYLFCSFGLAFGLFVGLALAYAQWATEVTPWGLLSIPVCFLLGALLVVASQVGQRLGNHQMQHLGDALTELTQKGD